MAEALLLWTKQELLTESRSNIMVGLARGLTRCGSTDEAFVVSPGIGWELFGEGLKLLFVRMTLSTRDIMDNKSNFILGRILGTHSVKSFFH